jgi:ADP-ribose pyrophosphatase YjhB (NUDIX family)
MWQLSSDSQLHKVTAFITRGLPQPQDLLILRHPLAGAQIPSGTVEAGESPRDAVLRHASAETGLHQLAIVSSLGVQRVALQDDEAYMAAPALLQTTPDESSTLVSAHILKRGYRVRILESHRLFVRVSYEEGALRDGEYTVIKRHTGWVQQHSLTRHVERHFFHLMAGDETPQEWQVHTDTDHVLTSYWAVLRPDIPLTPPQSEWLAQMHYRLTRS